MRKQQQKRRRSQPHRQQRRRPLRRSQIETLEARQVMSADPLAGLLGGAIEMHAIVDEEPVLVPHAEAPALVQHNDIPSLGHHLYPDADFWLDPNYGYSVEDTLGDIEQQLNNAHDQTGLDQVRADYGWTGIGQTVAVIDSGIAWDHYALGGGYGASYRVVGGWDFTEGDSDPYDDGSAGRHGTHVSGIIGSSGNSGSNEGVAPGVDLVGLRVFNDDGAGYFSWVESALQWVHTNRNNFDNPITTVNLSLGTDWNSDTVPGWAMLEEEFAQLEADGIFISVSAGNGFSSYNTTGLSYPAASSYVVPVMATDDNGSLSYFSQRHTRAIAAPGRSIVSTVPDYAGNNNGLADDWGSMSGTSMAAPYVAGASVIIRQAMDFVGYTGITQDTIYDHMMATADTIFDAATSLNYKRLNLEAAIDALMPSDDFGSTAGTAFALGSILNGASQSGMISTLSDVDCFTFTADFTGTATFTASNTTHQMSAKWWVGNDASWQMGSEVSFEVVAGQTYTVGLASTAGLGHYDLDVAAEAAAVEIDIVDWGTVTGQLSYQDKTNSGETWYHVVAGQSGYLTAQAMFASTGGGIDIAWYDTDQNLLINGANVAYGERVDWVASAGDELLLKVSGTNSDIDFQLTNLVSFVGSAVTVNGTAGNDAISFTAGTNHQIVVNGVNYLFADAAVDTMTINDSAGSDTLSLTGSAADEVFTLSVGSASIAASSYDLSASGFSQITAYAGGGNDTAHLNDSAGDDIYTTWWNRAIMYGNGYWNDARGFDHTIAYASTGYDVAYLRDSAGDDTYTTWSDRGVMSGSNYSNEARGFDQVIGYATTGNDVAELHDTAGNDFYTTWSNRAVMYGAGYWSEARDFEQTVGYATDGFDRAVFRDTAGNDTYTAWWNRAVLSGSGYSHDARGFDQASAFATSGNDEATFYDTAGDDTFTTWSNRAVMYGSGYWNDGRGFDRTIAYATTGYDVAYFRDSAGDDVYSMWFDRALMSGSGYSNDARGFDKAIGYASTGYDRAEFYDSVGDDVYSTWSDRAVMYGTGFWNDAQGFDRTTAYSTSGNDLAVLRDSSQHDAVHGSGALISISAVNSYLHEANGFSRVAVHDTDGDGTDEVFLSAVDAIFTLLGNWVSS